MCSVLKVQNVSNSDQTELILLNIDCCIKLSSWLLQKNYKSHLKKRKVIYFLNSSSVVFVRAGIYIVARRACVYTLALIISERNSPQKVKKYFFFLLCRFRT